MINFDALPKENPFALPTPGVYKAHIEEATMKKPKTDATRPPYLNLKITLFNHDGTKAGTIFDTISESDSQIVQYKIGRFAKAVGLPLQGSMELADIAKLVVHKDLALDVSIDDKGQQPRSQVDLFSREAYYPIGEYESVYELLNGDKTEAQTEAANAGLDEGTIPDATGEVEY